MLRLRTSEGFVKMLKVEGDDLEIELTFRQIADRRSIAGNANVGGALAGSDEERMEHHDDPEFENYLDLPPR